MNPAARRGTRGSSSPPGEAAYDHELPLLRDDLRLHRGAPARDGTPTWTIEDPLAQCFHEVDACVVSVLSLWSCGRSSAVDALMRARGHTPPDAAQWRTILDVVERHGLQRAVPGRSFARLRQARPKPQAWWLRILHGYLFFKLPLLQPDTVLRRMLPWVAPLYTRTALAAWILAGLLGLHLLSRQWERFAASAADLANPGGLALLMLSLAGVKLLHELGHGLTAARHGARVGTMGVAFIVMVPVLYTDTTDAWRLSSRRARMAIGAAGMAVELMVAVVATLAWCLLADGAARDVAFALATTGWTMSLVVNLNPLMRFDGYHLAADALNLPNLQERSFVMGRWWLRRALWGWKAPQPEACSLRRAALLIAFAWTTWLYRLVVFVGIALLVYHFFFKLLGVLLFLVEITWFIALPIARELRVWQAERVRFGARAHWTAAAMAAALLALFVPWPGSIVVPVVVAADTQAPAFAPRPARIAEILVREGELVQAGQLLLRLEAPEIDHALARAQAREGMLHERLARAGADARDRADLLVLGREHLLERERIAGLERDRKRLGVRAPIDGRVMAFAPELHAGRWVDDKMQLAWVAQSGPLVARGYMHADDAGRLDAKVEGRFRDEAISGLEADARIERVASVATRSMDLWLLASSFGGAIPTRQVNLRPQAEHALIEVKARLQDPSPAWPAAEVRGKLRLQARPASLAERAWRRVVQVWMRERSA